MAKSKNEQKEEKKQRNYKRTYKSFDQLPFSTWDEVRALYFYRRARRELILRITYYYNYVLDEVSLQHPLLLGKKGGIKFFENKIF